jgi:hypothetical protein
MPTHPDAPDTYRVVRVGDDEAETIVARELSLEIARAVRARSGAPYAHDIIRERDGSVMRDGGNR